MKTIEERAKQFVNKLPLSCANHRKEIESEIILLLKREQKLMRHACAENIILIEGERITNLAGDSEYKVVSSVEAHQVIINTQIP